MRIKKFLIFFLLAVFLLSPVVGLAQFKLQQTYPTAGGSGLGVDANGNPISASKSIPSLVKYLFNLTVWVCILVAIIVLIAGGVQYVTSSGDVGKMTGAKTRIYGSLLGLIILIGAWFVLHTMNPSLVLPKITYIPIKQGIVFFTKEGYDAFIKADDPGIINDLVQSNQAKIINNSIPDLTSQFGPLVFSNCDDDTNKITIQKNAGEKFPKIFVPDNLKGTLNFADFQLYTIAFWGKKSQGAKLIFYNQLQYQQLNDTRTLNPQMYDHRGLLDKDNNPIGGANTGCIVDSKIKDAIIINPGCFANSLDAFQANNYHFFSFTATKYLKASNYFKIILSDKENSKLDLNNIVDGETLTVDNGGCGKGVYFNLITDTEFRADFNNQGNKASHTEQPNIKHPPLSMKIIWSSPGVYLVDANGDERYFDTSANDLSDLSINFDQKAQYVKIINDTPDRVFEDENGDKKITKGETRDFLAILHENDNFSGKLKVYFEQRMYKDSGKVYSPKAKNKFIPAYSACGWPIKEAEIDQQVGGDAFLKGWKESGILSTAKISDITTPNGNFYFWKNYNFGELPMVKFGADGKVDLSQPIANQINIVGITQSTFSNIAPNTSPYGVEEGERYGNIDKSPRSVEVFELADNPNECKEVKLCTEKSGKGYCLAYTSDNAKQNNSSNIVYYPMPVYLPVHLPKSISSYCKDDYLPEFTKSDGTSKEKKGFSNNIKSIIIEGKCAVVLVGGMENVILDLMQGIFYYLKAGARSEVFTSSDYNLDDNEIGQCGTTFGFNRWISKSCAVGIAVYPIK
ncbi:MAG: pilin [bacterium]